MNSRSLGVALSAASHAASDGECEAFLSAATAPYGGDLLNQTSFEWAEPFRVDYRVRAIDAFVKLAERRHAAGEIDAAIEALDAVTRTDPYAKDAHRCPFRLLLAAGRRDAARDRWRQLRENSSRPIVSVSSLGSTSISSRHSAPSRWWSPLCTSAGSTRSGGAYCVVGGPEAAARKSNEWFQVT